ncbi:MAG TPA: hypothetical protein VM121_06905 [Acidimicrobiales bacterium]|nr:hypothetical protein [Acidimicrobiales bacterium]
MTGAQTVFVVALTVVATAIVGFTAYVVSSTMWGDRWYPRRRRDR